MKRKLDLRTGKPVWFAYRAPRIGAAWLTRDIRTEVLVIGIGISGAMIAERLTADGHEVVCVDRRGPLKGSTPATTALVQFEIDQPLSVLSRKIGRIKAERAWRRSRLAVGNLQATIGDLGLACDLEERRSLYLAGNVLGPDELQREGLDRQASGLWSRYLPPRDLRDGYGIDRKGALLSAGNLALDPRKLTAGLLKTSLHRKARFLAPVEATAIEHARDDVTVATKDGPTIRARHLVLATGYELMEGVPAEGHDVISTWAIATAPQPRALWPGPDFIWEASDPYLYMRTTPDGRIICGGEDEEFTDEDQRDALIAEKTAAISSKLKRLFPQVDATPQFAWAGAFGTTPTGLPIISTLPRRPRIHVAMGYGGNGITFSRIAAEVIASHLAGKPDSDADLFELDM